MRRVCAALIAPILVAACTSSIVSTAPQDRVRIGFYTVVPQIEWNRQITPRDEVWTVDGFALQSLRFVRVAHGQSLAGRDGPPDKAPVFRKTMSPHEVRELVVDTLVLEGWANVRSKGLRPAKFGDVPGFRFSFEMLAEDGLEYDGIALGTVRNGALHLILYKGTRLYHYPKYAGTVQRLVDSIRTDGQTPS